MSLKERLIIDINENRLYEKIILLDTRNKKSLIRNYSILIKQKLKPGVTKQLFKKNDIWEVERFLNS